MNHIDKMIWKDVMMWNVKKLYHDLRRQNAVKGHNDVKQYDLCWQLWKDVIMWNIMTYNDYDVKGHSTMKQQLLWKDI